MLSKELSAAVERLVISLAVVLETAAKKGEEDLSHSKWKHTQEREEASDVAQLEDRLDTLEGRITSEGKRLDGITLGTDESLDSITERLDGIEKVARHHTGTLDNFSQSLACLDRKTDRIKSTVLGNPHAEDDTDPLDYEDPPGLGEKSGSDRW